MAAKRSTPLRRLARSLRGSLPFSVVSTTVVKAVCDTLRNTPEAVALHLHRHGPVDARLPNGRTLRLWSRADDGISNTIYWYGLAGYEPESLPLFYALAEQAQVTLDVGAHVGLYGLVAAHANPAGTVYAFEAMEGTAGRLQANLARNDVRNVRVVNAAVGEREGTLTLFHDGRACQSGSSRLQGTFGRASEARMLSLDDFVDEARLTDVDLVKIDVEGGELQVFQGMGRILERFRPTILCEVLRHVWPGRAEGLEAVLRPHGYRYFHLAEAGPVERETIEGQTHWLNYLFTREPASEIEARWRHVRAAFAGLRGR